MHELYMVWGITLRGSLLEYYGLISEVSKLPLRSSTDWSGASYTLIPYSTVFSLPVNSRTRTLVG